MEIQHQEQQQKGEFFLEANDGKRTAELTYFWNSSDHLTIDHTWVDDSLRGQGAAKKLFDAAIAFAREKHAKIIPVCSYAAVMFQRDQSIADLLYQH